MWLLVFLIMKFRAFPETNIKPVSVIGFGVWTVSTGWWGNFTDEEAVRLLRRGRDLGINFYDAADTYGNGRSEELLRKAFEGCRDEVVIATKVGYDFYSHEGERRGQSEIEQNFSVGFIREAVERCLKRLGTDYIDLLQLHNIRMEQVEDDALWGLMEDLVREGKILGYGAALGPAIGWLYEGIECVRRRKPHVLQHIYNMLETYPGRKIMDKGGGKASESRTRYLIRVTHSSGMLEGKYTLETKFPPTDHRAHRPRSWLVNGLRKIERLKFLVNSERTLGQVALLWLMADERVASCLPNIYNEEQLVEFAGAADAPPLTDEELAEVDRLIAINYGIEEEPAKYKGTMERVSG